MLEETFEGKSDIRHRRVAAMQMAIQACVGFPAQIMAKQVLAYSQGFEDYILNGDPSRAFNSLLKAEKRIIAQAPMQIAVPKQGRNSQ